MIQKWLEELISEEGILNKTYRQYTGELDELRKQRKEMVEKISDRQVEGKYIDNIDRYIKKIEDENTLVFLSRKNIIPKYGFPVDTVELATSLGQAHDYKASKLRLQRDLMVAISEYAPGSEIIADGNIYQSQYIKKPADQNIPWDLFDFGVCQNKRCGHLNIKRHISEENSKSVSVCEICGDQVYMNNTFIIPEYGFIISPEIQKSTTKKPDRSYRGEIHYIGDKEETIEKEHKEISINNHIIRVKSTSNDELAVINTSDFFVCDTCGYAKTDEKHQNNNFIMDESQHDNPYGKKCANRKLYKRTLGHKFKTDVAYISWCSYLEKDKALSILYALLEGVSQYLGIERNDISGTLHYNKIGSGEWETDFVLFDTVPGGAGHVRRIAEGDAEQFENMLRKALQIVSQCNCGEDSNGDSACYSCLCNYYNQKHHDIIKRRYAKEFFENILC